MYIPKAAIDRAIEGGWKPSRFVEELGISVMDDDAPWQQTALDPSFWQALGKALGWESFNYKDDWGERRHTLQWKDNAHRFYELILTGGDTEMYWKELLSDA